MDEARPVIRLEGDLDIARAPEVKERLIEALSSEAGAQLDLSAVSDADITAVQLLWTAMREAEKRGISFGVDGEIPEVIAQAINEAGLEPFLTWGSREVSLANPPNAPTGNTDGR
jgi:anti-anti-sigma factor